MPDSEIKKLLDALAESIVLGDPTEADFWAGVKDGLLGVQVEAERMGQPEAAALAGAAAELIPAGAETDPAAQSSCLGFIDQSLSALVSILVDGHAPDESNIPAASSLDCAAADTSGAGQSAPTTEFVGDPELTVEFVGEAKEHLDDVDNQLLTLEKDSSDAEALNAVFRAFHTIKGVAGFLELESVQRLAHEAETALDAARKGDLLLKGTALDLIFEANDALKSMVADVEQALLTGTLNASHIQPLVEKLKAVTSGQAADPVPQTQTASSPVPARASDASGPSVPHPREGVVGGVHIPETIKVDADRLDALVDTIGELVIAEAMVSESAEWSQSGAGQLPAQMTQMDKITRKLQQMAMSLRMVPIQSTFHRMARLARDVAKKLDKKIAFTTSGEDTELDKSVVDAIGDPLVHMIRNAVDHGLEADRPGAGKPDVGRLELRAFHKGGSICIEVEDDGGGLQRDEILAKGLQMGLVAEGDKLSEGEVFNLLFEPGFSTSSEVSDLSGRGVGLDVVRRNIEALRGKVEISSEAGKGTVFTIRLPLTLAIIEGMVVRVGQERFIVPTLSIVRMLRPAPKDLSSLYERGAMLTVNESLVPLHRLDSLFSIQGAVEDMFECSAVIVEDDNRQHAFLVDELLGQQQIVIKPLGEALTGMQGVSGGAIMPDGQVALILDVGGLVKLARTTPTLVKAEAC